MGSKKKSAWAQECDSKRIDHVTVYQPKLRSHKIRMYHYVFIAIYVVQFIWVFSSIGQPYREFLERADREGFQVMEGSTKMRAQLEYALKDLNDPNRRTEKIGWFDWMDMDIEEHAELKKREKEKNVLDSLPKSMRVPKRYSPAFTPCFITGVFVILHALVILLQHWLVSFNVWINYNELNASEADIPPELLDIDAHSGEDEEEKDIPNELPTHARVSPSGEKDVLLPIEYFPTLGMTFEYHRRKYYYDGQHWVKIRCATSMPVEFFATWKGFDSPLKVQASFLRFGANVFDVKQPTFMEMYKKQLLSPFTVFQIFCVVLWLLDDYWQYSFFTLFMILIFEATVVFSRIKSLGALKGMGNTSRPLLVYRHGAWKTMQSVELLPGDVLSLTKANAKDQQTDGDLIPADILMLRGSTVVNEASLTGESVPQMKEGLSEIVAEEHLDMKNKHKTHVLYAGTKILQCKGPEEGDDSSGGDGSIPNPTDGGCLCFVLRTGFSSAQGKLVRMIEGSQEKVKGHERETGLLLLLLFFFALASSSYVLYHGWNNPNRSQYELLLHCILIITSVIPPELPMQMAMAVNNSLMTLMKLQVFCTEPFRVPIAGKLDACLFDKTGTLTTDELVAVGVFEEKQLSTVDDMSQLTPMTKLSNEAGLVLAGCHSLVLIEEETTGDPLESAALNAMRWEFSKSGKVINPKPASETKEGGLTLTVGGKSVSKLEILARHHFSSKLQRMSCVVKDIKNQRNYSVVKGSPEAIGKLLKEKPANYSKVAKGLAKRGYRVIALAYKVLLSSSERERAQDSRASCEEAVTFAGFIAFTCRVRKDTKMVLKRLKEGGMTVAMVTGDALLTAAHVAKKVDICDPDDDEEDEDERILMEPNEEMKEFLREILKDEKMNKVVVPKKSILILEQSKNGSMFWQSYDDESHVADFIAKDLPTLSKTYDLATTGKNLAAAFEYDEETKKVLAYIKIFARMTPDAKETVIECLHSVGALCLMCGDGANDVGALKQADVGVALLSGFGDINVDKGEDSDNKKKKKKVKEQEKKIPKTAILSAEQEEILRNMPLWAIKQKLWKIGVDANKTYPYIVEREDLIKLYKIKGKEHVMKMVAKKDDEEKKKIAKLEGSKNHMEKQRKIMERVKELADQGESWAQFKAMKEFWDAEKAEGRVKKAEIAKKNSVEGSAASLAAQLEDLEMEEIPMVKIGDASIAAPFTSKMPSIRSCIDIVRQGRCTLVTSIQMYQILALNCLISAYSLSVLYLDGVKYGDVQMTSMGMLMSVSFMSVSRSKPLDRLSAVKPLTSIFHPSLFISLLGQFSIHLATMFIAVRAAKEHLPPDYEADLDGEFKPGILNSVVFLVSNVQQVTVFVVNLQGRPFMTGLTENRPLLWSLVATFILTFMFASESVPSLNKYFQLVSFPNDAFRDWILKILIFDVFATFLLDRLMKLIFCPAILYASVQGTTIKDVLSLGKTIGMILGVMYVFLGNEETWEELLREDGLLDDLANNVTNVTDAMSSVAEACVGAACETAEAIADEL